MIEYHISTYEDFHQLKKLYEDNGIELPFDPKRTAHSNLLFFDIPYSGPLVGATVEVKGRKITAAAVPGKEYDFVDMVGEVVAHCHDRIIVSFTGINLYVGWYDPDDFRVLNIYGGENSKEFH